VQVTISEMELDGEIFALKENVILEVCERDFCGVKVIAASHNTFGVMSIGNTHEEAISRASGYLVTMYHAYTKMPDHAMSNEAIMIKNRLKMLV
jgi:hypothetical protein